MMPNGHIYLNKLATFVADLLLFMIFVDHVTGPKIWSEWQNLKIGEGSVHHSRNKKIEIFILFLNGLKSSLKIFNIHSFYATTILNCLWKTIFNGAFPLRKFFHGKEIFPRIACAQTTLRSITFFPPEKIGTK